MKYYIIATIFGFLCLACRPDFNTEQKNIKYPSTEKSRPKTEEALKKKQPEEELKKKQQLKNTLLNDLKKQIESAYNFKEKYIKEMEKEPSDQYGIQIFKVWSWGKGTEKISDNTERSVRFRRHTYTILSTLDIDELKEFSNIILLATEEIIFGSFSILGGVLDTVSNHLYHKKDNLNKLDISDLKTLKNSLDKILSIIESVSRMSKQLVLDYENNKDFIKTNTNKLESHVYKLKNEFKQQAVEARNLKELIVATY
ncbi:virulence associated lipoprotein [Borreliella carolinensis]|uniref:Virulence associated lipoprotein n=1 Tax=Borreliella carolinensis TaxID=478174 RepID=A0ACD5GLJ6_9SPIR